MSDEPRYATVHLSPPEDRRELTEAELWELGATGLEERDGSTLDRPSEGDGDMVLVAHFQDFEAAEAAAAALPPACRARVVAIVGDAWREGWRAFFKVTRPGRRLVLRPAWEAYEPARGEVVLSIEPGQAFGTGTHETTRLVLRLLEDEVREGARILDLGCGSGILSVAALLFGAAAARAVDIDPAAVRAARENAARNGVEDRLEADDTPLEALTDRYALVVANIESRVLVPAAAAIADRVAPGGALILSGLLADEEPRLQATYAAHGPWTGPATCHRDGGWIALLWRRPGA